MAFSFFDLCRGFVRGDEMESGREEGEMRLYHIPFDIELSWPAS